MQAGEVVKPQNTLDGGLFIAAGSGKNQHQTCALVPRAQAQAQLDTRMAFRPSSIKSRAHKRLTAVMDKRHGFKGSRMQATTTVMDPHREKAERARAEEARIRDR